MTRRLIAEVGFWLVALAPVVLVLSVPVLVVQDGGLHLSAATALGQLLADEFSDVIVWRPGIPPNTTAELVLLGLIQVLSPAWALKVLVSAVLVSFALASRYLVTATGVLGPWAVLLLPFAWHRPLAWGFLGFSASVALALTVIGMMLRRPTRPRVLTLAVLLALTWFTHLVPALVATAVCAAIVVAAVAERRQNGIAGGTSRALIGIALGSLPVLLLTAAFLVLNPPGRLPSQSATLVQGFIGVVGMTRANVSTVQMEYVLYRLIAMALYTASAVIVLVRILQRWRVRSVDALLVSAILGTVAAMLAPQGVNGAGGFLGERVSLFPPLLLAVWVAAHIGRLSAEEPWGRKGGLALAGALGLISLLLVTVRAPALNTYSQLTAEVLELAPCLPVGSTVLQIPLDDGRALAVEMSPLSEQVGFVAAERQALDMGNEAGWVPYYFWKYRDDRRPDLLLGTEVNGIFNVPPRMNLAGALRKGVRLDAIVVFGRPSAQNSVLADGPTQQILRDLDANYKRVRTSSRGAAELWLRNGINKSCS